jgi:integrase/recombinase XerD
VTQLRKMMLEELQRRNYSQTTVTSYVKIVAAFAKHFDRPPDQMGPEQIRAYQVYLINERKLNARTVGHHTAALRFFYCKTLKRAYPIEEVPYPKAPRNLPTILTQEEVVRLIDSASNLFHRAMLMTVYSTGMRRAEMCQLKVADIDSDRMLIHIRQGKGRRDRDVPLSPKTAGDIAPVLAVDEAEDVPIPRHGQRLTSRQTDHTENAMGGLPGSRAASRHHQSGASTLVAAQLCHASVGGRR